MPDTTSDSSTEQPPEPQPVPVSAPEPEASTLDADPEGEVTDDRIMASVVRGVVSSKDIKQFLTELTKQRCNELLDLSSDHNITDRTLLLPGTSTMQVLVVRRWLERFVVPNLIDVLDQLKDKTEVSVAS